MRKEEVLVMRAVAICHKPYLKPEEALIYCNLGRTQFAKRCEEFRIYKNGAGYFAREDLNRLMSGEPVPMVTKLNGL
ncbi:hypothetical protein C7475_109137 [Chitinophaga sp. S165]|nr:hypothetical protein C7475_109137 [Chitinophaga sp. S165]